MRIGVFDSGYGGLTVVRKMLELLPNEEIIYFGDTKRCPYGNRSYDELKIYTYEIVEFLLSKGIKALVVACNTITAYFIEELRNNLQIPVIGVIEPGVKSAIQTTRNQKIGIIATNKTIESKAHERELMKHGDYQFFAKSTPEFVPMIEKNRWTEKNLFVLEENLKPFKANEIDTLILGCTHYPIIEDKIKQIVGEKIAVVDPSIQTAIEIRKMLYEVQQENRNNEPIHQIYTSGDTKEFENFSRDWLKQSLKVNKKEF